MCIQTSKVEMIELKTVRTLWTFYENQHKLVCFYSIDNFVFMNITAAAAIEAVVFQLNKFGRGEVEEREQQSQIEFFQ